MAKFGTHREQIHQPIYDTLVRSTDSPATTIQSSTMMFGNANVGNLSMTNMQSAGMLSADQTFVAMALRAYLFFDGLNARRLYQEVSSQLFFTLILGEKPMFTAPCWYHPAGGGIHGSDAATAVFNHGTPSQEAILKLARPIVIPARQNIQVNAQFFPVGTTNILTLLNAADPTDQLVIMYLIDGLKTRDVQ